MRGIPKRGRGKSARSSSEAALLRAFEQLLRRHGVKGVRVNALLEQAGVGKRLLYEYFGDLQGLAAAWAKQRSDPLALGRRLAALHQTLLGLPENARIAAVLVDYANHLSTHPWAAQVMIAELSGDASLGRAMRDIRREMGREYERLLVATQSFPNQRIVDLGLVLHAAANYLALRAKFAPDYNGINLASSSGWRAAMYSLTNVAQMAGVTTKRRTRTRPVSARAMRQAASVKASR